MWFGRLPQRSRRSSNFLEPMQMSFLYLSLRIQENLLRICTHNPMMRVFSWTPDFHHVTGWDWIPRVTLLGTFWDHGFPKA